jgi:hypothetical protein
MVEQNKRKHGQFQESQLEKGSRKKGESGKKHVDLREYYPKRSPSDIGVAQKKHVDVRKLLLLLLRSRETSLRSLLNTK